MELSVLYSLHLERRHHATRYDADILQVGMYGDPWRVVLASLLLQQTTRRQAQKGLANLLDTFPDPERLGKAHIDDVAQCVHPCGLQRRRAPAIIDFSQELVAGEIDLEACIGIGRYVCECVAVFCFDDDKFLYCGDWVLEKYAAIMRIA